jgi:SAM-dependent methyltransferase
MLHFHLFSGKKGNLLLNQEHFNVPGEAVKYLLMQRTGLQRFNPKQIRGLRRLPLDYETLILPFEAVVRRENIKTQFTTSILQDYHVIRPYLPETAASVLDVGCGIAGIDAALFKHYGGLPQLYLLDRTETSNAGFEYGMGGVHRFYNSLELAQQFLTANGVNPAQIHLLDAQPGFTFDKTHHFDLVISLISWGYHYPVETYLDQVYDRMNPGGHLILDVRKGHGGEDQLRSRFGNLQIISETGKEMRCVTQK